MKNSQLLPMLATLQDVEALAELDKIGFATDRLKAKQFKHFIKSPTSLVCVMKDEDKIIANAVILFRKNSAAARIYSIIVSPEYRKMGLAQILYFFLESQCITRGCTKIKLEVRKDNQQAINFYLKNGYESFGVYPHFYEDGHDALRMHKILKK